MSESEIDRSDRFLLDHMLGTLAVYLRMCGYDAAYAGDRGLDSDEQLVEMARHEDRIVLSRDREVIARAPGAIAVRSHDIVDQLAELRTVGVSLELQDPPRRCGRCNGLLVPESAPSARPTYTPDDPAIDCWECTSCGQYFWKGSHWDAVEERL